MYHDLKHNYKEPELTKDLTDEEANNFQAFIGAATKKYKLLGYKIKKTNSKTVSFYLKLLLLSLILVDVVYCSLILIDADINILL